MHKVSARGRSNDAGVGSDDEAKITDNNIPLKAIGLHKVKKNQVGFINEDNEDTLISSQPKLFGTTNAALHETQNPKASAIGFSSLQDKSEEASQHALLAQQVIASENDETVGHLQLRNDNENNITKNEITSP